IELLGLQRRDHAVPVNGDEFAGDLHLVAERLGDVDVEADELAVRRQAVEGRIGSFRADDDLFLGGGGAGEKGGRCDRGGGEEMCGDTHDDPLCWRPARLLVLLLPTPGRTGFEAPAWLF